MECDAITIDCWDTLLRRDCAPEAVKLAASRRLAAWLVGAGAHDASQAGVYRARIAHERALREEARAAGHDPECRLEDVLGRVIGGFLPGNPDEDAIETMAAHEAAIETAVSRADPVGVRLLERARGMPTLVVSDFYMGGARLSGILRDHGLPFGPRSVLSSCDHMACKTSGRLLAMATDILSFRPDRVLHVGDSRARDVVPARRLGMKATLHQVRAEDKSRSRLEDNFRRREYLGFTGGLRVNQVRPSGGMAGAGRQAAALFAAFGLFLHHRAEAAGLRSLLFFAREGVFLERVYRAAAAEIPASTPLESGVIEVSRRATFLAALEGVSLADVRRRWRMTGPVSLSSLCTAMDVDVLSIWVVDPAGRASLGVDEKLPGFFTDARVISVFGDRQFADGFASRRRTALAAASAYLSSAGAGDHSTGLVDIGWRGSIQDNVARILGTPGRRGFYMGLLEPSAVTPPGTSKEGFLFDRASGLQEGAFDLAQGLRPLEMLCNARCASLARYLMTPDGVPETEREADPAGASHYDEWIRPFQDAVIEAIPAIARDLALRAATDMELRVLAVGSATKLLRSPPLAVAEAFFAYSHDESFDRGGWFIPKPVSAADLALSPFVAAARRRAVAGMKSSGWHAGALRLCAGGLPLRAAALTGLLDNGRVRRLAGRVMRGD